MLYNAKNGTLNMGNTTMDYIRFGSGQRTLVMLPGLGDGLRSMKGTALPMAFMYREFCKDFTVYAFSRKNELPEGYTTRDMAKDQAEAMAQLGIEKADIFGVSMGGMIAQHLAIDYPEKVNKLILTVTSARTNPILTESIDEWVALAKRGDHAGFMDSNLQRIYSDGYYRRNKWLAPIVGKLTKPKTYDRFFVQANACLTHDAYEALPGIACPTLVLGGGQDAIVGPEAAGEIAARIPGCESHIWPEYGHAAYEEAKDFQARIITFADAHA